MALSTVEAPEAKKVEGPFAASGADEEWTPAAEPTSFPYDQDLFGVWIVRAATRQLNPVREGPDLHLLEVPCEVPSPGPYEVLLKCTGLLKAVHVDAQDLRCGRPTRRIPSA
jgi:hypothetical protein